MLTFIQNQNENDCVEILANAITKELDQNKKVLWLVPGGSNITLATNAMRKLVEKLTSETLSRLAVTLTDERYGPVGHDDSNWQQLSDVDFLFPEASRPVLVGLKLDETIADYAKKIEELFDWADIVIGHFGIGADGHIAGVLPHTPGVTSTATTVGYQSPPYVRLSITLKTLQRIDVAYAFVFGASKKEALTKIREEGSLDDIPSRVLKLLPEAYVYTDQELAE